MKRDMLVCDEGISSETLSSWRDGFSQGRDAEWLRQHIATCRACQETLAHFDNVTFALRRQRELDPGDQYRHGQPGRDALRHDTTTSAWPVKRR